MKVGHTRYYFMSELSEEKRNATLYRDTTAQIEGTVLLTVAVIGGLGNLLVFSTTAACSRFRTTSCAFLSHHCILDLLKSIFCIPFACALLLDVDIPYCNALGATYIFLMTLTAYNLLAIHINEEYQLSDRQGYIPGQSRWGHHYHAERKNNSFWCVCFGIFMIWFTTVLLHLGVAFLPSSAEFNYDIGNCVFEYGTPKNYVIHVLWTILVTAALVSAILCFTMFFCKLRARMHSDKWTLLHTSISRELNHTPTPVNQLPGSDLACQSHQQTDLSEHSQMLEQQATEELHYEFADGVADQTATRQMKLCLRRVVVMLLMAISFLLFWYPLFILTIIDFKYTHSPQEYRICMIVAWSHPVTTPIFCGIIFTDMMSMETLTKSVYTAAIPLKDSTSFSSTGNFQQRREDEVWRKMHQRYKLDDVGFTNENFSFSNHGSPSFHMLQHGRGNADDCESLSHHEEGLHRSRQSLQYDTEVYSESPSMVHTMSASEGQEHSSHHSCSGQDSYQTLIM